MCKQYHDYIPWCLAFALGPCSGYDLKVVNNSAYTVHLRLSIAQYLFDEHTYSDMLAPGAEVTLRTNLANLFGQLYVRGSRSGEQKNWAIDARDTDKGTQLKNSADSYLKKPDARGKGNIKPADILRNLQDRYDDWHQQHELYIQVANPFMLVARAHPLHYLPYSSSVAKTTLDDAFYQSYPSEYVGEGQTTIRIGNGTARITFQPKYQCQTSVGLFELGLFDIQQ